MATLEEEGYWSKSIKTTTDYTRPYVRSRYIWGSDAPWVSVDISLDALRHLDAIAERMLLTEKEVKTATARAINRTLTSIRAECIRIASQRYTIPAREYMKNHSHIFKAMRDKLKGTIIFEGHAGTPLSNFVYTPKFFPIKGIDPRKRKPVKGPQVKILRASAPKQYFGTDGQTLFFETTKKGFSSFWYAEKGGNITADGTRARILRPAFGPSPIQALSPEEKRIQKNADSTLATRMRAEINYIIQKNIGAL
jgi:hypothetical protein